jgi:ADP-heptose:LPS heptosyltransferase
MIKAIGTLHGLFGDLVMTTSALKSFKRLCPRSHFTFAVSNRHASILPLFEKHPLIDAFHVWEGDDYGLTDNDKKHVFDNNFDIFFDPFPKHTSPDWYNRFHYLEETALMLGLAPEINPTCYLTKWFDLEPSYKKCVALSVFPSRSKNTTKTLSVEKWNEIVAYLKSLGYRCIQLGGIYDLQIEGAEKPEFDFVQAAQCLCSCDFQITTDTSWAWIGSAYRTRTIGFYTCDYVDIQTPWSHCPPNANAKYFWVKRFSDATPSDIISSIISSV